MFRYGYTGDNKEVGDRDERRRRGPHVVVEVEVDEDLVRSTRGRNPRESEKRGVGRR